MRCNSCKGTCKLIGYNLEKCLDCGNEQKVVYKPSLGKTVKDKLKRFIGLK